MPDVTQSTEQNIAPDQNILARIAQVLKAAAPAFGAFRGGGGAPQSIPASGGNIGAGAMPPPVPMGFPGGARPGMSAAPGAGMPAALPPSAPQQRPQMGGQIPTEYRSPEGRTGAVVSGAISSLSQFVSNFAKERMEKRQTGAESAAYTLLLKGGGKLPQGIALDDKKSSTIVKTLQAFMSGDPEAIMKASGTPEGRGVQAAIAKYTQMAQAEEARKLEQAKERQAIALQAAQAEHALAQAEQQTAYAGTLRAETAAGPTPTDASLKNKVATIESDPNATPRERDYATRLKDILTKGTSSDHFTSVFLPAYAEVTLGKGKTPKDLSAQQNIEAFGAYKEASADPDVRAAALQSAQTNKILKEIQIGQQPTREDAKMVSESLLSHKMAPSQLSLVGGWGVAGTAFRRMVLSEALKADPNFNLEEAEADYQFSKTPQFQRHVRFIDHIVQTLPLFEKTIKALPARTQIQQINKLLAAGQKQFGGVNIVDFNTQREMVASELGNVLAGLGANTTSKYRLEQAQGLFTSAMTTEQLVAAINQVKPLLQSRRRTLTHGTYMSEEGGAGGLDEALDKAFGPPKTSTPAGPVR